MEQQAAKKGCSYLYSFLNGLWKLLTGEKTNSFDYCQIKHVEDYFFRPRPVHFQLPFCNHTNERSAAYQLPSERNKFSFVLMAMLFCSMLTIN